jgi:hypothetical protein
VSLPRTVDDDDGRGSGGLPDVPTDEPTQQPAPAVVKNAFEVTAPHEKRRTTYYSTLLTLERIVQRRFGDKLPDALGKLGAFLDKSTTAADEVIGDEFCSVDSLFQLVRGRIALMFS